MERLPKELRSEIFNLLCIKEKQQCRLACKQWFNFLTDDILYHSVRIIKRKQDRMLQYFCEHRELGVHVKHLKARQHNQEGARKLMEMFPNVKYFKIDVSPYNKREFGQDVDNDMRGSNSQDEYDDEDEDEYSYKEIQEEEEGETVYENASLYHPWQDIVEIDERSEGRYTGHTITTYLLSRPMKHLKSIVQSIFVPDDSNVDYEVPCTMLRKREFIHRLVNAPALSHLTFKGLSITIDEIELIHLKATNLTSLTVINSNLRHSNKPLLSTESYSDFMQSVISANPRLSATNITKIDLTVNPAFFHFFSGLDLLNEWLLYAARRYPNLVHLKLNLSLWMAQTGKSPDLFDSNMAVLFSSCPQLKTYDNMLCTISEPITRAMDDANLQISRIKIYAREANLKHQLGCLATSSQAGYIEDLEVKIVDKDCDILLGHQMGANSSFPEEPTYIDYGALKYLSCFSNLKMLHLDCRFDRSLELIYVVHVLSTCHNLESFRADRISFNPAGDVAALVSEFIEKNSSMRSTYRLKHLTLNGFSVIRRSSSLAYANQLMNSMLGMLSQSLVTFTFTASSIVFSREDGQPPIALNFAFDMSQHYRLKDVNVSYRRGSVVAAASRGDRKILYRFGRKNRYVDHIEAAHPTMDFVFDMSLPPQGVVINSVVKV